MPRRNGVNLTVEQIADDLHPLACPLDWITLLTGNPRRGKVEAVVKSYTMFGQRKPIVVNKTGEVDGHPVGYTEAGNHQVQAMREMGWTYSAMVWVEEDEQTAKAFSLADNKTHDLGEYDTPLLAQFVGDVAEGEGGIDLLDAAGFAADEMTRLITLAMTPPASPDTPGALDDDGNPLDGAPGIGLGTPVISTTIVFDTAEQQQSWYTFIRALRTTYPDADTTGERLHLYLTDNPIGDDE